MIGLSRTSFGASLHCPSRPITIGFRIHSFTLTTERGKAFSRGSFAGSEKRKDAATMLWCSSSTETGIRREFGKWIESGVYGGGVSSGSRRGDRKL